MSPTSCIVGIVVTTVALLSVFSAQSLVDPRSFGIMVTTERHVDAGEEFVHANPKVVRARGMTVHTTLTFKHEQGIRHDVDEIHVVINNKRRFFVRFHGSSDGLGRFHSGVGVKVR